MQIDWSILEKTAASKELTFESFNFQIAYKRYSHLGDFEYDYNTPGAEFFLTLRKDCPELDLKISDVLGWQAKFWVNHKDLDNTQMGSRQRAELQQGLSKALKLQPNLKVWFICTPGQIDTKSREQLENDLHSVKPELKIVFWNKPIYESHYHESQPQFNPIFCHYFSTQFIGYEFLKDYTAKRINRLKDKFDTDLYVSSSIDNEINLILDYNKLLTQLELIIHDWHEHLKYQRETCDHFMSDIDNTNAIEICLSDLLRFLINFGDEFHTKVYSYKDPKNAINALENLFSYVNGKIDEWNAVVEKYQTAERVSPERSTSSENYLNREITSQYALFTKIINLDHKFFQAYMHIFGKAGYGKTNLACAVCANALEQGIPSLLILASDIRAESDISNWIVDSLHAKHDFISLLGFLNNLGFLKQRKIPVVIDGLNEKYPDASYWKSQLQYLTQDVTKFRNILLITTSRESYTQVIFERQDYKDVPNNYYLEGFGQYDLSIAITKYFRKYRVTINNADYDKTIFQNPLLLKIFCTVHEGKTFTFYPTNIYETMATYYRYLIDRIAEAFPGQKSIMPQIIEDRLNNFCLKLINNNSKHIDYQNDFFNIFDPDFTPSGQLRIVMSDRLLDEGMFIKREMLGDRECVEFTHDFIGGYSLAKTIALSTDDPQEITDKIRDQSIMEKVIDFDTGDFRHPLSEDILRNLIYFFKNRTGGQLYHVLTFESVLRLTLSMLEIADPSAEERQELTEKLLLSEDRGLIISFFEEGISRITDKNDYCYTEILLGLLKKLSARDIDLYWSETIRKNRFKILNFLYKIVKLDIIEYAKKREVFLFLPCLFSSTDRLIRDLATKVLVNLGENSPETFLSVYKQMEDVRDLYIHERLIATLCGIVLRKGKGLKEVCLDIAEYLEKKYFQGCCTTHLLILDYVDTILYYVSTFHGYIRSHSINPRQLTDWLKDNECIQKITGDGEATWGYGPIRLDFAKYTIGHHIAFYRSSENNLPTVKEAIAMIIWRMKRLGYDEKVFEDIDRECAKSRHEYSRTDNSGSIERYGKKYSWIAFFELYGQFVLQGRVETETPSSFRVSSIDIDPTFPTLPRKEQLVTECFLPRSNEDLQAWVNKQDKKLLRRFYRLEDGGEDWILINCRNCQQNTYAVRIDINVDALMFLKKNRERALNLLKRPKDIRFDRDIREYYYLFNGEIPWGKLLQSGRTDDSSCDSNEILFYSPFSWFTWESYHSRMNDIGNVPFLTKAICDEFDLRYNIQTLTFFDDKSDAITKYYHDKSSHYYFIKGEYLNKFLHKNDLSLVWREIIYKYGDFGIEQKKGLNPSFREIKSTTIYKQPI